MYRSGIYQIRNLINDKIYIGSAVDIANRWSGHKSAFRENKHHARHLQHSWNKYGEKNFELNILFYCDKENLILFEQRAMDVLNPEYNTAPTAGSSLGTIHSDEARANMSEGQKGRFCSNETRAKLSKARKGEKNPNYGKTPSDETRAKMSKAKIGNTNLLGHKFSEEAKANMSKAHKGKKLSEETKAKIGKASIGNTHRAKPYPSFISPNGTVYPPGIDLKAFCREHDLNQGGMWGVKDGRYKQCKGWKLNHEQETTIVKPVT